MTRFVPTLALAAAISCLASAPAYAQPVIRLADGRMTVRVADVPLRAVIDRFVALGVLEVVGQDRLVGSVSADIDSKPVLEALDALLSGYNFVVTIRPNDGGGTARYVLRVHSRQGGDTVHETGPIYLSALEAALLTEQEATEPDPDDVDPDADAEQRSAAEEFESDFAERERSGELSNKTPLDEVEENVHDDNPLVRIWVLDKLSARDARKALPHLISALSDDETKVANHAVDILSRWKDAESLKELGETLTGDTDTILRIRAFVALARRGDPRSAPYVEAVTKDPNQVIRESAAQFLSALARRQRPSPPESPAAFGKNSAR